MLEALLMGGKKPKGTPFYVTVDSWVIKYDASFNEVWRVGVSSQIKLVQYSDGYVYIAYSRAGYARLEKLDAGDGSRVWLYVTDRSNTYPTAFALNTYGRAFYAYREPLGSTRLELIGMNDGVSDGRYSFGSSEPILDLVSGPVDAFVGFQSYYLRRLKNLTSLPNPVWFLYTNPNQPLFVSYDPDLVQVHTSNGKVYSASFASELTPLSITGSIRIVHPDFLYGLGNNLLYKIDKYSLIQEWELSFPSGVNAFSSLAVDREGFTYLVSTANGYTLHIISPQGEIIESVTADSLVTNGGAISDVAAEPGIYGNGLWE